MTKYAVSLLVNHLHSSKPKDICIIQFDSELVKPHDSSHSYHIYVNLPEKGKSKDVGEVGVHRGKYFEGGLSKWQ